ncbi:uncharacterized protein LOC125596758 isoform X2 [Brassica napus]|uniref:uncharacterized protein LOC125596758 isoform X2 n=1 Tax=Brassica napus TaxID=3708 RepID=UPI0020789921|nr:uncharacterized protein LOC125596758 isoform X2 [Brassica napus]
MTMVNVEDESVHGGAGDGDGTVNDDIAGSVAGEIGLSAKKLIHEASRSMELASSQPDASTILPTQLTVLFGRKVSVSDEIEQKRFKKSSVLLLLLLNPLRQRLLVLSLLQH